MDTVQLVIAFAIILVLSFALWRLVGVTDKSVDTNSMVVYHFLEKDKANKE